MILTVPSSTRAVKSTIHTLIECDCVKTRELSMQHFWFRCPQLRNNAMGIHFILDHGHQEHCKDKRESRTRDLHNKRFSKHPLNGVEESGCDRGEAGGEVGAQQVRRVEKDCGEDVFYLLQMHRRSSRHFSTKSLHESGSNNNNSQSSSRGNNHL